MRSRLIFIVLAILVVGGFAALNWSEFTRSTELNFGVTTASVPLGLVLLGALAVVLLLYLVSSAALESRHLLEHRRNARALQSQRDLAEKAEASRYTDLRQHIDTQMREVRQQRAVGGPEFERTLQQNHQELRSQIEQMTHVLAGRIGELESRMSAQLSQPGQPTQHGHAERVETDHEVGDVPLRDRVRL